MLTKEQVINSLKDMPDKFSIDDLMDKLILLQRIQVGLKQSEKGQVYTVDEAKEMLKKWSK
jgi:predicted flavoprotein YhiN